jgi:hypothetical protein
LAGGRVRCWAGRRRAAVTAQAVDRLSKLTLLGTLLGCLWQGCPGQQCCPLGRRQARHRSGWEGG